MEVSDTPEASDKTTPEKKPKLSTITSTTSSVANRTGQVDSSGSSLALSGLAAYSSSESDED